MGSTTEDRLVVLVVIPVPYLTELVTGELAGGGHAVEVVVLVVVVVVVSRPQPQSVEICIDSLTLVVDGICRFCLGL